MSGAMFSEAINVQTFMQHLLSCNVPTTYHQDNEAVIRILASGYSAKLRHSGRVHRINIAAMSEQLASENVTAVYCHTQEQIANGFTKAHPARGVESYATTAWHAFFDCSCCKIGGNRSSRAIAALSHIVLPSIT